MISTTDSAINIITQNLYTINWIKDLILPIIGVIIGGFITLKATSRANKNMLKYEQEILILKDISKLLEEIISDVATSSISKEPHYLLVSNTSLYFIQDYRFLKNSALYSLK